MFDTEVFGINTNIFYRIDEKEEEYFSQSLPCPYITISIKDSRGKLVEANQNLCVCAYRGMGILVWGQSYHMQSPLQTIENRTLMEITLNNYDPTTRNTVPVATGQFEIDFGTINSGPVSIYLEKIQPPTPSSMRPLSFSFSSKNSGNSSSEKLSSPRSAGSGGYTLLADLSLTQRMLEMLPSTLEEYVITTFDLSKAIGYNYKVIFSQDRARDLPSIRFLAKLPNNVVPGETIKHVGGRRGVHIKVPNDAKPDEVVLVEASVKRVYGRLYFYNDIGGNDGMSDDDRSSTRSISPRRKSSGSVRGSITGSSDKIQLRGSPDKLVTPDRSMSLVSQNSFNSSKVTITPREAPKSRSSLSSKTGL